MNKLVFLFKFKKSENVKKLLNVWVIDKSKQSFNKPNNDVVNIVAGAIASIER